MSGQIIGMKYPVYAANEDVTFIMEDTFDENECLVSTEVIGFHFGEPTDTSVQEYSNRTKAEFDF